MTRLITRGCFTQDYAKALVASPEDREPAVRKLVEAAGAKLLNFYFTTGETDWMVIAEFADGADLIPALLVVSASGAVSNVKTVRAYTGAEFKAAQGKAGKIASSYKSPAK